MEKITIEEVNDYKLVISKLDKLFVLSKYKDVDDRKKDIGIAYEEMNSWILDLVNLYNEYGVNLQSEIFSNSIFPQMINDSNKLIIKPKVKAYMDVFYKNMGDLGSVKYRDVMIRECKNDSCDYDNPIFGDIRDAFHGIYTNYGKAFEETFSEINEICSKYNIQKVSIKNIKEVRNCILKRVKNISDELKKEEEKKKRIEELSSEVSVDSTFNIIDDVCNRLTNGKFMTMTDFEKDNLYSALPQILEIVVKYKLFDRLRGFFDSYDKEFDRTEYNDLKEKNRLLEEDLKILTSRESYISEKNVGILYPTKAKIRDMEKVGCDIRNVSKRILENKKKLLQIRINYMDGFYKKVDPEGNGLLKKLSEISKMDLFFNEGRLFGTFPFEMLPLDIDKLNAMDIFVDNHVAILNEDNSEFIKISNMCANLLNTEEVIKLRNASLNGFSRVKDKNNV